MEKKTEQITLTGFIGKDYQYHKNEETKKSVISLSVKPGEEDWVRVKAFNETADLIKQSIDTDGIKKFGFTGKMKDGKPYENKAGETVNYQELVVDLLTRYKPVEINGVVAKVEDKTTTHGNPYTHLFIKNNVQLGEEVKTENFNVNIYSETRKNVPQDVEIAVGKPLAIKGEQVISQYLTKAYELRESMNITARYVDRTPSRLREQVEKAKQSAIERDEKRQDMAESKPKKTPGKKQDAGISM